MPNVITLSKIAIDKAAQSITIKAVLQTEPGGPIDGQTTSKGTLKVRYWTDTTFTDKLIDSDDDVNYLFGSGLVLTPQFLGISTNEDAAFADGVYQLKYTTEGYTTVDSKALEGDLKVLVDQGAEKCIASQIGKLAAQDCDCTDCEEELNKLLRWRFAAPVQFDCKDYDGAHNLVVAINQICGTKDCGCH
jgi:hypothetical protein